MQEAAPTTEMLVLGREPAKVPPEIRDVSFSSAVRGYDRHEVDAYVERVNTVIAELEIGRSPQSAVKLALDRVGEQTAGVLQRAREAAEELTAAALAESEHATRRARVEAEELVENAESQARSLREQAELRLASLHTEIEDALAERERVLEDLQRTAAELEAFANAAARRPPAPPAPQGGGARGRPLTPVESASGAVEDEDAE